MVYLTGTANADQSKGVLLGMAGCIGCVCQKEIGDPSSRISGWQVLHMKNWGRHCANYYTGNLLKFSYVSLRIVYYFTVLHIGIAYSYV